MTDVVYPLQKEYFRLLSGVTYGGEPVPVYYQYLPDPGEGEDPPPNYIIFGSITDNDQSTMNSQDSLVSIQVKVHTWADKYNDGTAVADIAGQVLGIILPAGTNPFNLRLDGLNLTSTVKANDFTEDWTVNNQRIYIDRTIQFSHNIFYLNN